jgi:hypothetical protein
VARDLSLTQTADVNLMAKKRKLELTETTAIAQKAAATLGSTREGRDKLTRASHKGAIKVMDTHGKQWNRYSP